MTVFDTMNNAYDCLHTLVEYTCQTSVCMPTVIIAQFPYSVSQCLVIYYNAHTH